MFLKFLNRVLVASLVMMVSFPSFAADKIGNVVAVVGSPSASGPSGNRSLKKDSEVFEDDTITVTTGNAQLILNDGTRIVVGPSSKLLLDQFVMGENQRRKVLQSRGCVAPIASSQEKATSQPIKSQPPMAQSASEVPHLISGHARKRVPWYCVEK